MMENNENIYNESNNEELENATMSIEAEAEQTLPLEKEPQSYEEPMVDVFVSPVQEAPKAKKRRLAHRFGFAKVAAIALCCSLLGGAVGAGAVAAANSIAGTKTTTATIYQGTREATVLNVSYVDTKTEMSAAEVYAANVNSTVGITTSATTNYFGYQTVSAASGSGFILTENGYIVTNYHVVEDADTIKVTTYDDTVYEATLVGCDESNDVAVLKIDAQGLTPVVLGNSDQLYVGDSVIAIGNPLGELTFSLTAGSISAMNRKVTINNTAMTLIQTDCAINSGNSGGALFNRYGEVIGITNAKYSGSGSSSEASIDNIGFAIPINSVREIISSIIEDGSILKPYVGISMYDLDSRYQRFGLSGVAVESVEADSPAAAAGLQADDIITKVNGKAISGTPELQSIVAGCAEGDILTFTVSRQGETLEIAVTIAVRSQSALPKAKTSGSSRESSGQSPFSGGNFPG